jgi:colanic acid/amylovoran biosynthesis protein
VTILDRGAQTQGFKCQRAYENAMVELLLRLQRTYHAQIDIFIQCGGPSAAHDDRDVSRRVVERLRQQTSKVGLLDDFRDAPAIKAAYQRMDCIIASRMHTAVFALSAGVPVVLIGYQPKSCGMMELFGLPEYCYDIDSMNSDQLFERIQTLLASRDALKESIETRYVATLTMLQRWTLALEAA